MSKQQYSRRGFFRQNSMAGLGILAIGSLGSCATTNPAKGGKKAVTDGTTAIADMDLEEMHERYKTALLGRFIPNMNKYIIDHELGGFMCTFNLSTRKLESTDKRAWYEGRGIWTYSFLYNNIEQKPEYLAIAKKSIDFILKQLPEDDKFLPGSFTKEGAPRSKAEGDIYGNLFVAEGLAEYAKATGERYYFNMAKKILLKAAERYDRPDFVYAYKAEKRIPGARILGHWMILLSLCTQLLKQQPDAGIQALADRCVEVVMKHHINPAYGLVNEAISHDYKILDDKIAAQYADIGHGCETFAFIMAYAVLRKEAAMFHAAAEQFKKHVTVAIDPVYGGYFRVLENTDSGIYILPKVRWVPEEILIGSLLMIEHTGDPWAIDTYIKTDAYIKEKFTCPELAFVADNGNRQMDKPSLIRAEHYHHPRQLMVCMLAIERILSRNRKTSGLFN